MTLRDEKLFRFMPFDSFTRDPGKDFTPEAIENQVREFVRNGGQPQVIPYGVMKGSEVVPLRNRRQKAYRGPGIELNGARNRRMAED